MQSISVFLGIKNLLISGEEKADITSTQEVCHVIYIFLDLLRKGITMSNFIIAAYV